MLSAEERQHVVTELKRMMATPEFGKGPLVTADAFLGDEGALQQLVWEFIEDDGQSPYLLAPMQIPASSSWWHRSFSATNR